MEFLKRHCHFLGFAIALLLVCLVMIPAEGRLTAFALGTGPTGVIVPLYVYPGEEWDDLIAIKNANPSVPMVAVINPDNGPGSSEDPNYDAGVQELQSAGIVVLGYTWTNYGERGSSAVRTEINKYVNWYSVDGVFFDAMSNLKGKLKYYNNLDNYAKGVGLSMTVGNVGTDTRLIYIGSVDNIVIYENDGTPALSFLGGWHNDHDKSNFSFIAYDVNSFSESFVTRATNRVGYMYITDDDLPNPYDSIPDYLSDLVSVIASANS